jgi:hypothetical protein
MLHAFFWISNTIFPLFLCWCMQSSCSEQPYTDVVTSGPDKKNLQTTHVKCWLIQLWNIEILDLQFRYPSFTSKFHSYFQCLFNVGMLFSTRRNSDFKINTNKLLESTSPLSKPLWSIRIRNYSYILLMDMVFWFHTATALHTLLHSFIYRCFWYFWLHLV